MVLSASKILWIHKCFKTIWYKAESIDDLRNLSKLLQFMCGSNVRHYFHVGFDILLHIYNPKYTIPNNHYEHFGIQFPFSPSMVTQIN